MKHKSQIFTIPNLLSLVRLLLIPLVVWLYIGRKDYLGALGILILSGLTDVADGYIARRFHMVSDLGKALDPIADKLTQAATLACLSTRFSYVWLVLAVLMVKELFAGIVGLYTIKKSGQVEGADWHGKVNTALLYGVMGLHMLVPNLSPVLSSCLLFSCLCMMCLSGVLYWLRSWRWIKGE